MMRRIIQCLIVLCYLSSVGLCPSRAQAAALTVTNLTDSATVDGCTAASTTNGCTLREAITDANADATTPDAIIFANGLAGGTLTLTQALPDLTTNLTIENPGNATITLARSGDAATPAFTILTVNNVTPNGASVTLTGLTLSNGNAVNGGAIHSVSSTLIVNNCTLSNSVSSNRGGGIDNSLGSVTVNNSTVSGNTAVLGGGLYCDQGTLAVNNSTVYGNTSTSYGGGIRNSVSNVTVNSCTITKNTAPAGRGSGIAGSTGNPTTVSNSIIVGNTNSDVDVAGGNKTVSSGSYNLVGTSDTNELTAFTAQTHDQTGVSAGSLMFGPLQGNGGPTPTIALLAGSVAIDVGNTPLANDQRGVARPLGSADDVGAYEFNGTQSLVVTTLTDENNGTSDPTFGNGTSLREAINYANSNPDQSDITFADNLAGGTITLTQKLPDLSTPLSIKNLATATITLARSSVDGTPQFSILTVSGGGADLVGLTLTHGTGTTVNNATYGGGLLNASANISLTNCTLSGNTAQYGGGLYNTSTAVLTNCILSGNTATNDGGGLSNLSDATLNNCTVSGNSAQTGGGIHNSQITRLNTCVFASNTASSFGGGVYNNEGTFEIKDCTFAGNSAVGYGGGVDSDNGTVNLSGCTFTNNSSNFGGALDNSFSTFTLLNCTLSGNTATGGGGGISTINGSTTVNFSTLTGNKAPNGGGSTIYTAPSAATTSARSVTRNRARSARRSTSAEQGVSARVTSGGSAVTFSNSIVVGNTDSDVDLNDGAPNSYASGGYNLLGTTSTDALTPFTANGDQTSVTAAQLKLGVLADNGGPTQTLALQPGSIAVNAGNPNAAGLPTTDQRGEGFPRVVDGRADVGAFEAQFVTLKGRVYNAVGRTGLEGITVQAAPTNIATLIAGPSTLTDDQGNYTLTLDAGTYDITASKEGDANFRFAPSFTNPVALDLNGTGGTSYDFRNIGIGGRVISPFNIGVSGVTLTLTPEGSTTATATLTSDNQGFFSFDGLAAGTYTVTPTAPDTLIYTPPLRTLTLADTPLFTSFKAASKIVYSVAGSVTINKDGSPQGLAGLMVTATRVSDGQVFTTQTGSDGSYNFTTLTEDRYTVTVKATGMVFTYAPTPKQSQPLVLTAKSPAKAGINFTAQRLLNGTVYNAVALKGIPRAVVKAVRQSDGSTVAVGTDENGQYTLALEAGTYTLSAFLPNNKDFRIYAVFTNPVTIPAEIPPSTKAPQPHIPGYDFRAVGIAGRVISPFNTAISGVTINLYSTKDTGLKNPLRSVTSDEQGFFSFDGIIAGTWNIVPVAPDTYTYTPTSRLITVTDQAIFTSFKASVKQSAKSIATPPRSSVTLSSASADAATGTLTLKFTAPLEAASVSELTHYAVSVDGMTVSVQSAQLSGGDTITLTLPQAVLFTGSQVVMGWNGVLDAQGLPLQGQTQLVAP